MDYKEVFSNIYENYGFGGSESRSGPGSTIQETEIVREGIKRIIKERQIKSVVDIPCGDFNWMKEIVFNFENYIGGDIVEKCIEDNNEKYSNSRIKFINFDLLKDEIPEADLLIVRDVIGHFPIEDGKQIIQNILKSKCKYLLSTSWYNVNDIEYYKKHENKQVDHGSFYAVNLMSDPFNFPEPDDIIEEVVKVENYDLGNRKVMALWDIERLRIGKDAPKKPYTKVTIVTGIWDLKRDQLTEGWSRPFDHYLNNLSKLMKTEDSMIIFIESKYKDFVEQHRKKENTLIIERELDWFIENGSLLEKINNIRTKPEWYNQSSWLVDSTQAKLEYYNLVVMSKMFLLNDASILDPFNSTHLVWVDGGISSTVSEGYFWYDKVIPKLGQYFDKFSFVCFPYDGKVEIHGFTYKNMCDYAGAEVDKVARGGIFGGPKSSIRQINGIYYELLNKSLDEGLMGTEESVFTIMTYKYPEKIQYYEINFDGLLITFFENLKNDNLESKSCLKQKDTKLDNSNRDNIALYVLTYNSPNQFETLCKSFEEYDRDFLDKPKKYLINNSLDSTTNQKYIELCERYNFIEIKKDNIGICGGRQFIAEHAEENQFDYYFFFEDDMFFYNGPDEFCRNGFRRKINGFYEKSLDIIEKEQFDFLKWNFSELYGDNSKQWAWYNVPQDIRERDFPENPHKTENDFGKEPFLKYKNIKSFNQIPYATGEIYYCNWPQTISRAGNKKMFLDTKWQHPYEQTWMSFMYQETVKGNIKPGILLATPTEHNRFHFYPGSERREN